MAIWDKVPADKRGEVIEAALAHTDYKDWAHFARGNADTGVPPNRWQELIDFVDDVDSKVLSVKSADTRAGGWGVRKAQLEDHIDDLATRADNYAEQWLDVRVQPGGIGDAADLIEFGLERGVKVILKEFP